LKKVRLPFAVWFLLLYLAGITIIGKGPTYIGVPPVFLGEVVMATGLLFIAPWCSLGEAFQGRNAGLTLLIVAWLILGAVLTAFGVPEWGLDALRDAAIWYYALFFFIGLGLSCRDRIADRFWRILCVFWIFAMLWGAADLASGKTLSLSGPIIPWRGVPFLFNARDESGQNLALGAFIVIGTSYLLRKPLLRAFLVPSSLVALALLAASEGRAVKLGCAGALAVLLVFSFVKPRIGLASRIRLLMIGAVPAVILALMLIPNLASKMQLDRFTGTRDSDGTAEWRLIWWQRLEHEVLTRDPLFGLGFGESLHVYHPALAKFSDPWMLRAPHNFNMTVFTRMGIVGCAIWAGILFGSIGVLAMRVWRNGVDSGTYSPGRREELLFWLAMIVYTFVNSSFGVLMEGPVLGIWFWLAMGFALGRSARPDIPKKMVVLADLRSQLRRASLTPRYSVQPIFELPNR
jgi:hypothetical protein